MSPDDRLPPRMCGRDGFGRHSAQSFRDALGADVVRRDQRDKPVDVPTLMCPVTNGRGRFGRISVSPVRPHQGPAKLGLGMTSGPFPRRGRPAARVEDHETSLADHLPVGRSLENERTQPVGTPTADHPFFDHGSDIRERRDGLFAQAPHDLRVREQVIQSLRVRRSWHAEAKPVRVEADVPRRGRISHAGTLARATTQARVGTTRTRRRPLAW